MSVGIYWQWQEQRNVWNAFARMKTEKGVDKEVQAACFFAKQLDLHAEYEFRKIHRKRVPPRRLDETSKTVATVKGIDSSSLRLSAVLCGVLGSCRFM